MNDPTLTEALKSMAAALVTHPMDLTADHRIAWVYCILIGGQPALQAALTQQHHWDADTVQRLAGYCEAVRKAIEVQAADGVIRTCKHCEGSGQVRLRWDDLGPSYHLLLRSLAAGPRLSGDLPMPTGKQPNRSMLLMKLEQMGLVERRALAGELSYECRLTADGRRVVEEDEISAD